jgi:LemA protein
MWWIALIVVAVILLYVVATYNSLVQKRNKVRNSWSQIDVQLKRRFDLIPNLLETVKGYAAHEKETLQAVNEARSKYMSAGNHQEAIDADSALTKGLGRLFAVAEAYPELKSNTNFMELQGELKNTEDKIGFARQFYNDVVMDYNNTVEMIPSSIIAGLFKFIPEEFIQIDEAEAVTPQVKF